MRQEMNDYIGNNYIGNNINALRVDKGLNQEQLALIAGVTQQTVSSWETGGSIPRRGNVMKIIAAYPELTYDSIMSEINGYSKTIVEKMIKDIHQKGYEDGKKAGEFIVDRIKNQAFVDVPLYGSIAAGTPIEMIEVDDTHPVPTAVMDEHPDAFLLTVKGQSMNRILPDGCYALIDPCEEIEHDNQPHAVCVNGYDATIKRVHKLANGFELVPDSTDPTYKPKVYDYGEPGTEEITVIGRVVYHVLPFDWSY